MKRIKFLTFLLTLALFVSAGQLFAQDPPLPPDDPSLGGDHKPVGDLPAGQSGGGAPIGSGTAVLLLTAVGYGIRKVHLAKSSKK
jgi:hypothetical protein